MTPRTPKRVVRDADGTTGYLLDSHVWVWMLAGNERKMPPRTWRLLASAAESGALHVSDVSCWEVALKAATGRYFLGLPVDEWIARATTAPGVLMLPLDRPTLLLGARLTAMHGDPADRWLVATAKLRKLTLLTADRAILSFAKAERLTAVQAAR
ncbi:MAG: type II toxin-antitoxin system VapC family toxin [Gemmatimonadales bacterium]|nr:type II toxin-antitoxin system VapC family toxin [Gemmatimonadales bacterium]MDZ4388322.1 type II toxin-antitoxin system VapC family toxin [Gemmatimonadales bacterium]